jgi:2-polyprenyl-3-methyl-5-hydroxy-6-metoxy-1,4-benzoquinol methylase
VSDRRPEHADFQERFVPTHDGSLITYEHVHRYTLAATPPRSGQVPDRNNGSGFAARMLRAAGARVVGPDLAAVAACASAPVVRGGAERLPFAAQSFDSVVCFEKIEHVTQRERELAEVARDLQPDGVALLSPPDTSISSCRRLAT